MNLNPITFSNFTTGTGFSDEKSIGFSICKEGDLEDGPSDI
jgi:hypothetical protein